MSNIGVEAEHAWLVERYDVKKNCPCYLMDDFCGFTSDPFRALRMSRKQDAEAVIQTSPQCPIGDRNNFGEMKAVEHSFSGVEVSS